MYCYIIHRHLYIDSTIRFKHINQTFACIYLFSSAYLLCNIQYEDTSFVTHGMYLESNVCYRYADAIEICNLYYRPPPLPLLPNNSVLLKLTILLSRGGRRHETHHLSIISYHQTFLESAQWMHFWHCSTSRDIHSIIIVYCRFDCYLVTTTWRHFR